MQKLLDQQQQQLTPASQPTNRKNFRSNCS
nr:hypothetical protein [Enterococcus faecium]